MQSTAEADTVTVTLSGRADFELGGRSGNVVTSSTNAAVGKGWRLLEIDGESVDGRAAAALSSARKRGGRFAATFFGGKAAGGGGMNMDALRRAVKTVQVVSAVAPAVTKPQPATKPQPVIAATAAPSAAPAPSESELRHEFVSFDFDRDGALGFRDFAQMLRQLNERYDFADMQSPSFGRLVSANYARAGGRRANLDEDEDEVGVTPAQFFRYYPELLQQLEQRRADEHATSQTMGARQFEAYLEDRSLELRNRSYPLLRGL
jgi:hypothetical protein